MTSRTTQLKNSLNYLTRLVFKSAILAFIIAFTAPLAYCSSTKPSVTTKAKMSSLPEPFVYLADICPDIIQDVRYATANNFTGAIVDGYERPVIIITRQAALKLKAIQEELRPTGYGLKVFDAYRPVRAVRAFKAWSLTPEDYKTKQNYYPNLDKKDLFSAGYISDRSAHSRGSTVDLTIVSLATKQELNMGTDFDLLDELSHTETPNVSKEVSENRMLLKTIMKKHGFENYWREWWHYQLKGEPLTRFPEDHLDFVIR